MDIAPAALDGARKRKNTDFAESEQTGKRQQVSKSVPYHSDDHGNDSLNEGTEDEYIASSDSDDTEQVRTRVKRQGRRHGHDPAQFTCSHGVEIPSHSSCSILQALQMDYSPLLACFVDVDAGRCMPLFSEQPGDNNDRRHQHLEVALKRIVDQRVAQLRSITYEQIHNHLMESGDVSVYPSFQAFWEHACLITLDQPFGNIPASQNDQCSGCLKWCASLSKHLFTYKNSAEHVGLNIRTGLKDTSLTVPLFGRGNSRLSSLQVRVRCPDSAKNDADTGDLLMSWICRQLPKETGPKAAKLALLDNGAYHWKLKGGNQTRAVQCTHMEGDQSDHAETSASQDILSTSCAVLSYFHLYRCPLLRSVVDPSKGCLLTKRQLSQALQLRVSGQPYAELLQHITELPHLELDKSPKELFSQVHCTIVFPSRESLPPGLAPHPQIYGLCTNCVIWVPGSRRSKPHSTDTKCSLSFIGKSVKLWGKLTKEADGHGAETPDNRYQIAYASETADDMPPMSTLLEPGKPCRIPRSPDLRDYEQPPRCLESFQLEVYYKHIFESSQGLERLVQLTELRPDYRPWWPQTKTDLKVEGILDAVGKAIGCLLRCGEGLLHAMHPRAREEGFGIPRKQYTTNSMASFSATGKKLFAVPLRFFSLYLRKMTKEYQGISPQIFADCIMPISQKTAFMQLLKIENPGQHWHTIVQLTQSILYTAFTTPILQQRSTTFVDLSLLLMARTKEGRWRFCRVQYHRCRGLLLLGRCILAVQNELDHNGQYLVDVAASFNKTYPESASGRIDDNPDDEHTDPMEYQHLSLGARAKYIGDQEVGGPKYLYGWVSSIASALATQLKDERRLSPGRPSAWVDNDTLEIYYPFCKLQADVGQLYSRARINVVRTMCCLRQLLQGCLDTHLREVSVQSFQDQADMDSIQPEARFQTKIDKAVKILTKLYMPHSSKTECRKIITEGQSFLQCILHALVYATGPPPRDDQLREIRYRGKVCSSRNLVILPSGHVAFVQLRLRTTSNIADPQYDRDSTVWVLPWQLGLAMLLYLHVYRPLELQAMGILRRDRDSSSQDTFKSYIFVKHRTSQIDQPSAWTTDHIRSVMAKNSDYSIRELRRIWTLVWEKSYQHIFEAALAPSVLDQQAQHTMRTAQTNYALSALRSRTGLSATELEHFVLVAEHHHEACFLNMPCVQNLPAKVHQSGPSIHSKLNYSFALSESQQRMLQNIDKPDFEEIFEVEAILRFCCNRRWQLDEIFCPQIYATMCDLIVDTELATRSLSGLDFSFQNANSLLDAVRHTSITSVAILLWISSHSAYNTERARQTQETNPWSEIWQHYAELSEADNVVWNAPNAWKQFMEGWVHFQSQRIRSHENGSGISGDESNSLHSLLARLSNAP
ncbi:hypothetical protein K474DRAFT_1667076 [Panus rudis PR-1116 ss-1]|nr:hypothetical protein K474DRAFT_1667076 [Panus rudis PR-1116 ss-1]